MMGVSTGTVMMAVFLIRGGYGGFELRVGLGCFFGGEARTASGVLVLFTGKQQGGKEE